MDAHYPTTVRYLGLSADDLAELGEISSRHARKLLEGAHPFPDYLQESIDALLVDVESIRDNLITKSKAGKLKKFIVFRNNSDLRKHKMNKIWPQRGEAKGAFAGPHLIAVVAAYHLSGDGRDIRYHVSQ